MLKSFGQLIFVLFVAAILLPFFIVVSRHGSLAPQLSLPAREEQRLTPEESSSSWEIVLSVYGLEGPFVSPLPLEEYLVGVLAAEMPAFFHLEALKAQAVVARTYALRKMAGSRCLKAEEAHLCTDSTCCQAWQDPQTFYASLAVEGQEELYQRLLEAVSETAGQVLTYQEELIEAVYHSTCGGTTEASSALWQGEPLPYLMPVTCTYCAHSPYYRQQINITQEKLAAAFHQDSIQPLAGSASAAGVQVLERTPSNRVLRMQIGVRSYSGAQVRQLLALPSTFFHIHAEPGQLVFTLRGHGHGVGLCQYGADGMGRDGFSYQEILKHYFPQTQLLTYSDQGALPLE